MADTIGVRELRQYASTYLTRVKGGETITVTERGRPIARLVPLDATTRGWREDWIERGLLRPATRPASAWLDLDPIRREPGQAALSAVLDEVRREDAPGESPA